MSRHPILTAVSRHTGIPLATLTKPSALKPRPEVSVARQIAAYLLWERTDWSYTKIAKGLGVNDAAARKAVAVGGWKRSYSAVFGKLMKTVEGDLK